MPKDCKVWFGHWAYKPPNTIPPCSTEHLHLLNGRVIGLCCVCGWPAPCTLLHRIVPVSSCLPSIYSLFTLQCLQFGDMFDASCNITFDLVPALAPDAFVILLTLWYSWTTFKSTPFLDYSPSPAPLLWKNSVLILAACFAVCSLPLEVPACPMHIWIQIPGLVLLLPCDPADI